MKQISIDEFLNILYKSNSSIMYNLFLQWSEWLDDGIYQAYVYNMNLILIANSSNSTISVDLFIFNKHNCIDLINKFKNDEKCTCLVVSFIGDVTYDIEKYTGLTCFEFKGKLKSLFDSNIKKLEYKDYNDIIHFTKKMNNDDANEMKQVSKILDYIENTDDLIFKYTSMYGYYEGDLLVGVGLVTEWPNTGHSSINSILVLKQYRRRKIGTKLVNSFINNKSNVLFSYECDNKNSEAISFINSLNFVRVGAREIYFK